MNKESIKKRIAKSTGMAPEVFGCVRLTVLDNNSLCIENHGSIAEYTEKKVGLTAGNFYIVIEGAGLILESLGQENIFVKGEITSIRYENNLRGR